jgi:uncharacterized repeat protein (TIGR01451 family)
MKQRRSFQAAAFLAGSLLVSAGLLSAQDVLGGQSAGAQLIGTKTVSGGFTLGGPITYTVILTNIGALGQTDNPGHEFTDVLPAELTLVSATATSGFTVSNFASRTVTWDGPIPAGGSVIITIAATLNVLPINRPISNQGSCSYDSHGIGVNDATCLTDDPRTATPMDPTTILIIVDPGPDIPALSGAGLALLCLALAGAALLYLRRNGAV